MRKLCAAILALTLAASGQTKPEPEDSTMSIIWFSSALVHQPPYLTRSTLCSLSQSTAQLVSNAAKSYEKPERLIANFWIISTLPYHNARACTIAFVNQVFFTWCHYGNHFATCACSKEFKCNCKKTFCQE